MCTVNREAFPEEIALSGGVLSTLDSLADSIDVAKLL